MLCPLKASSKYFKGKLVRYPLIGQLLPAALFRSSTFQQPQILFRRLIAYSSDEVGERLFIAFMDHI